MKRGMSNGHAYYIKNKYVFTDKNKKNEATKKEGLHGKEEYNF